jgi:nicotinamide-nucleotide amidase
MALDPAIMNAEIITIGDELLIGQVVDTNSAYLATELNKMGFAVVQITSVPDIRENIIKALDDAGTRADLVILTGGLGPTSDDITKHTLAEYFDSKLVVVPEVKEKIRVLLGAKGIQMNDRNISQAELPDRCEILNNSAGTAQGMWFKKEGRDYISLPGVPFEMKAIYKEEMEPRFRKRFALPAIQHLTVLTHGVPESLMANMIKDWEEHLPVNLKLAYLPQPGILRLRITGKTTGDEALLSQQMEAEALKLKVLIGEHIFGYNEDTLETIVGKLLKDNNFTLSAAESCTGGLVSSLITSVPGSSAYYKGGVIAYSNEIKTRELDVSPVTLMMNGAVSQPVAEQMADGIRKRFNTDFSVAITGIAGPDGGTAEKPVGTVWIAVASGKKIIARLHNFGDNRGRNAQRAAISALFMLRKEIMNCL